MLSSSTRLRRAIAGALAGATALAVVPILGFAGVAGAADALPPVAQPVGNGNVCDNVPGGNDFIDVDPASAEVINCLLYASITTGTSETTFSPNGTVTRRQMALFVKRQIDLANGRELADLQELPAYDGDPGYTDVAAEDEQFKQAIGQLAQAEIVGGFLDGTYRPAAPISRRQMAAFVNRTQVFLTGGGAFLDDGDYFDDDDDEAQTVQEDFNGLAAVGIFQGDGQGNVSPAGALTRRQMANILLRHLQVNFEHGAIAALFGGPGNQSFTVTPQEHEVVTVSDAAAPTRGYRDYTVAVPVGESISIGLFDANRMGFSQDTVAFFDDDDDGSADGQCETLARIELVDGEIVGIDDGDDCVTAMSTDGTITFTINSATPEEHIRPVVWTPETEGGDLTIDPDACQTFTEPEPARYCQSAVPVGAGGVSLYVAEET